MSDNIPLNTQRASRACSEGELYILDVFSFVQLPRFGTEESLNQLIMSVTSSKGRSGRLAFIQVWNSIMAWKVNVY